MIEDLLLIVITMLGFLICGWFVAKLGGLIDEINGYEIPKETYRVRIRKILRKMHSVHNIKQIRVKSLEIYKRWAYSKRISIRKR